MTWVRPSRGVMVVHDVLAHVPLAHRQGPAPASSFAYAASPPAGAGTAEAVRRGVRASSLRRSRRGW
jgi:hypothetical protein